MLTQDTLPPTLLIVRVHSAQFFLNVQKGLLLTALGVNELYLFFRAASVDWNTSSLP